MEPESSLDSRANSPETKPTPELSEEDHSRERVLSSDVVVMEDDSVRLSEKKVEMGQIFDQIQERASSILQFSLKWDEIEKHYDSMENLLKEKAMEVEVKEKSVMEQIVELEKKEERLKEVELLQESMTVSLEMKETEINMKHYMESSVMRMVFEMAKEEVIKELEEREKEVERLCKLNDEKSLELEREVKEFDLKQKEWIETRNKEAEFVKESLMKLEERAKEVERLDKLSNDELERKVKEFDMKRKESIETRNKEAEFLNECLKQLEARQKEISLLDEAIKELIKVERKDENFEAEQNKKSEELEMKSRFLELREKKLEEKEKELELKQRELQERAEFRKRSSVAERGSEADSLLHPSKKLKSHRHDDKDLASVVSLSASSSNKAHQEESDEDIEQIDCLDSEFHDFKKTASSFVVDTVWALYDPIDLMPRFYAKIKRIAKSGSSIEMTWLEPCDEESVPELPVACGRFVYGETETTQNYLAFSHEMQHIKLDRNFITINPSIGETWALFRDWSRNWINNPEQHKPPYKYDLVEVVRSFDDKVGVGVAYLGKVGGFVSVFEHAAQHEIYSFMIGPEEMQRFSHRVPSFRMNGEEKKGVPTGSFELDPAAIPSSLLKVDHSIRERAKERGRQNEDHDQDESRKDPIIVIID